MSKTIYFVKDNDEYAGYYDRKQTARILHCSKMMISNLVDSGQLKCIDISMPNSKYRQLRFSPKNIKDFLDKRKVCKHKKKTQIIPVLPKVTSIYHDAIQVLLKSKKELNGVALSSRDWIKELRECSETKEIAKNLTIQGFASTFYSIISRIPNFYQVEDCSPSLGTPRRVYRCFIER